MSFAKIAEYSCIVADPPWAFGDKLPGKTRGAVKNYTVMSVDGICALGRWRGSEPLDDKTPPFLAMCGKRFAIADDCLLFLWRVSSQVEEAYSVCRAWGFVPKSEIVWLKTTGAKSKGAPRDPRTPFVRGSDTSEAAAESVADSVEAMRALVFEAICASGEHGRTCDAIERRMAMLHQTASARVRDLALMGVIKDSGKRRKTRSGRLAVVWVKAPLGSGQQPPAKISHAAQKLVFGMGRYVRNCHESCIIAARGKAASIVQSHSVRSVFYAPVREHSQKPEEFFRLVEELAPGPRLELFAREPRPGWTTAGDEIGVLKTLRDGG